MSGISQSEFAKFLDPYSLNATIAIAVSGGADSMALILLMHEWAQAHNIKVIGLTVDHQLRIESTAEATQVHNWLQQRDIEHHTLVWHHTTVTSALQKKAREARYQLLKDWCRTHQVNTLMTAHHLEDQWETFMMRLSKGSGLKGLRCIQSCIREDDLEIIRPLLSINRDCLKKSLERFSGDFVQDPSNLNTQFERIRWRQLLPTLAEQGLTPENIGLTIERFQTTDDYIQQQTQIALRVCDKKTIENTNHCHPREAEGRVGDPENKNWIPAFAGMTKVRINLKPFKELHPEIAYRILTKLLLEIGGHPYPLPYQSLKRLYHKIITPDFIGTTGGGCYLKKIKGGWIEIHLEQREMKTKPFI